MLNEQVFSYIIERTSYIYIYIMNMMMMMSVRIVLDQHA
jgi:hypothetical protein